MNNYTIIDETLPDPMVSVAMLVYNHENFIVEAIESVLKQEVDFRIQLVIAEDFSTDKSREIVLKYQRRHPQLIKLILQNKNVGAKRNNQDLLSNLQGKYIAALEGDDYWNDSLKLQKQVTILENNIDCSMVCHNADVIYENSEKKSHKFSKINISTDLTIEQVINKWIIPTASMVFRRNAVIPLPNWFGNIYSGDFTLALLLANSGRITYIKEVMSVYRVDFSGSSASSMLKGKASFIIDQHMLLLNYFNEFSCYRYSEIIKKRIKVLEKEKQFLEDLKISYLKAILNNPIVFTKKTINKLVRKIYS